MARTSWYNLAGKWDSDDLERLHAIACHTPIVPFEEAYARLEFGTDVVVARQAFSDFVKFWHGSDAGV